MNLQYSSQQVSLIMYQSGLNKVNNHHCPSRINRWSSWMWHSTLKYTQLQLKFIIIHERRNWKIATFAFNLTRLYGPLIVYNCFSNERTMGKFKKSHTKEHRLRVGCRMMKRNCRSFYVFHESFVSIPFSPFWHKSWKVLRNPKRNAYKGQICCIQTR